MASEAHGKLYVLVWSDDGVIKPVVLDTGALPVTESVPLTELDVTIKASDITVPVSEQSPLSELDVTIKASDITVPIAEQSPISSLYAKQWGYWGGAWRNQPLIWGYTDSYLIEQQNESDVDASYTIDLPNCPSGQIYRVMGMAIYRDTVTTSFGRIQVAEGVSGTSVEDIPITAAGMLFNNTREVILKSGQNLRVVYVASEIGEIVITTAWGYKMQTS